MEKKIIIIGAGIAGLSAGIYARYNGYAVEIVEQHTLPGGLCTAWKRNGYTFDGCIHWLVGSSPGDNFHKFWMETGALPGNGVIEHEEFIRIGHPEGKELIIYTDADRLEEHMISLAPEDEAAIREMTALVRKFAAADIFMDTPQELMGLFGVLKMLKQMKPFLKDFNRYNKMPLTEYVKRFKNPVLRDCLGALFGMDNFPTVAFIFTLASLHKKSAGWPLGGSLEFAKRMEARFRELGGTIRYGFPVEKILVEKNRACGVRLAGGKEIRADRVISAADGYATIYKMLDGKYVDRKTAKSYREEHISPSALQVSFGVKRDFSGTPHSRSIVLNNPLELAGQRLDRLSFHHYGYDPSMAPDGGSVLVCILPGRYNWWKNLDEAGYREAKKEIMDRVSGILEQEFPGFREAVETSDIATPLTFARYTGNREGSIMGWATETGSLTRRRRRTLKGLKNFWMAGQWAESGGGLPPAVLSGRQIVQVICQRDKQVFVTGSGK